MQEKNNIREILGRHCEGRLNDSEAEILSIFLQNNENKQSVLEIAEEQAISEESAYPPEEDADFDSVYENIHTHIRLSEKKISDKNRIAFRRVLTTTVWWTGTAAAIVLLILFTDFGKSIKNAAGQNTLSAETRVCEVRTPLGARTDIRLGDGSQVSLNSGSVIYYDNNFNLNHREIRLEGEAYFKVAKENKLPFIVTAGKMIVRATGTEFNIKAYTDEDIIETTLVEGSVEVTAPGKNSSENFIFELHTNQKAVYLKGADDVDITGAGQPESPETGPGSDREKNIIISNVGNIDQVVSWTGDRLVMNNESMEELCRKLHRKYDVEISFSNEIIKSYRFSGILDDEPIEQVLEAITLAIPVKYTVDSRKVNLYSDKERFDK